ncbi:MAG: biotin transporter BioY, partial [Bacillota bacterium]|nr:biotin transporter BioY [Bacillota bacterium]
FFAALTAVGSWIAIPLPFTPVPVALASMVPSLAGALLGGKYGALSMAVYALLGAAGVPVFHNFTAGPGILAGPTGGYIAGYIASAFLCGLLLEGPFRKKAGSFWVPAISMALGLGACYLLGSLWFMYSTGTGLVPTLVLCVFPFLPGDVLKTAAAVLLFRRLRPVLQKRL